jgi:hypothetical protein
VTFPVAISSASRTGVRSVFSGLGPAPDTPGTVERRVLARMPQKSGRVKDGEMFPEINAITIRVPVFSQTPLNLSLAE